MGSLDSTSIDYLLYRELVEEVQRMLNWIRAKKAEVEYLEKTKYQKSIDEGVIKGNPQTRVSNSAS